MGLNFDAILDRRRLKRRLAFWRTAAIAVAALTVVVAIEGWYGDGLTPFGPRGYVARIGVVGVITDDRRVIDRLAEIAEDDAAQALIVHIDSPGGTVVGGEGLYNAFRKVAAEKPVVAVMGTTAASAGYMVALGAEHIFAHAGTLTGSIGVLLQTAELTRMLDKLGISPVTIKSSPLKAVPSPFEEVTPEARRVAQEVVDAMQAMFVDLVGERRGIEGDALRRVTDGRVFTGRQALDARLIDAIGGEDEARRWLETEHGVSRDLAVRDVDPREETSLVVRIGSILTGKAFIPERLTLDGLIAVWHPDLRS